MEACYLNPSEKTLENLQQRARREEVLQTPAGRFKVRFFSREVFIFVGGKCMCIHIPAREHELYMVGQLSCTSPEGVSNTFPLG